MRERFFRKSKEMWISQQIEKWEKQQMLTDKTNLILLCLKALRVLLVEARLTVYSWPRVLEILFCNSVCLNWNIDYKCHPEFTKHFLIHFSDIQQIKDSNLQTFSKSSNNQTLSKHYKNPRFKILNFKTLGGTSPCT